MNPFETIPQPLELSKRTKRRYLQEVNLDLPGTDARENQTMKAASVRTGVLLAGLLIGLGILVIRIITLQIVNGDRSRALAEGHRLRIETLKASRGIIVDRNDTPVLANVPDIRLTLQPADLPRNPTDRALTLEKISQLTNLSRSRLEEMIRNHRTSDPIVLQSGLSDRAGLQLTLKINSLPGIAVETSPERSYRFDKSISHLVGYVGAVNENELRVQNKFDAGDMVGRTGIEASYDDYLRGKNGHREIERDAQGKTQKIIASQDPVPGGNLRLTIIAPLQEYAQKILDDAVNKKRSPGGALVAIDPNNGEILSLVSTPAFDANAFVQGLSDEQYASLTSDPRTPLFNRAISGMYPPGSTIKPVIASAALQEHVINPSTTVLSTGGIHIGQWFFPDWKAGGHGLTDVKKALAESVNTFFYLAGGGDETHVGLGVDRIRAYAEKFGLNHVLGIDLPGEQAGFLPSITWKEKTKGEHWYIGDTYHLSIGQGDILVTPLQIAAYTMAIANNGTLYRPHVVKTLLDASNNEMSATPASIVSSNMVDSSNLSLVRQGLRQTIVSGSGRALADFPLPLAGKTGTAQFGNAGKTHAWFTAFAPYENPEIVVTVFIEAGGEGHDTALPVARNYLNEWLKYRAK